MNKSILVAALLSISFGAQAMDGNKVAGKEIPITCKPVTTLNFNEIWNKAANGFKLTRNEVTILAGFAGTLAHLVLNKPQNISQPWSRL